MVTLLGVALATHLVACDASDSYVRDLESGVLERQLSAAASLADHPTMSAWPALTGQLRSVHPELRLACARAILAGDDRNARADALRTLRRDALAEDPPTAGAAMEALIDVGGEALPDLMGIALTTPDPGRRAVATAIVHEALGEADSTDRAAPAQVLVSALESTDPERHRVACAILGALIDPLAAELIDQGLAHPRTLVRRSIVTAAGEQRVAAFAGPIAEMLHTPDTALRKRAVRALGEIGDPAAAGHLRTLEKRETQYEVRHEAREALRKLGVELD